MHLDAERGGDSTLIRIRSHRLDAANAWAFRDDLAGILRGGAGPVVIDLAELTFIDSSGLAALVHARKLVAAGGGSLHLTGIRSRDVATLLRITRLDQLFSMTEEVVVEAPADRDREAA